jgi:hypothetical protein
MRINLFIHPRPIKIDMKDVTVVMNPLQIAMCIHARDTLHLVGMADLEMRQFNRSFIFNPIRFQSLDGSQNEIKGVITDHVGHDEEPP